jgi:amidase
MTATERPSDPLGAFMVGPAELEAGRPGGVLSGARFAVKDLFDVAGTRTGAGNPDWLAKAPVAATHAPAVAALLAAGADLWGKTVTDELAFSLSGTNVHYGTPRNPAAPGRIPGGSSSGSASAVAGGSVDLALGTDTGGSVRVPASYCGIYGLRPTHGRIDSTGVVPLAPSFDTVGLFAADGAHLADGWRALRTGASVPSTAATPMPMPGAALAVRRLVLATDLLALADDDARVAVVTAAVDLARRLGLELSESPLAGRDQLPAWRDAFRVIQMVEVWRAHGRWIESRHPSFGPGIAGRLALAAAADADAARQAEPVRSEVRQALGQILGDDTVLVQPTASGPAPPIEMEPGAKDDLRGRTLMLTAPAGLAGAPVVSLPLAAVEGLPMGLALVGRPGDDDTLVALAEQSGD